MCAATVRLVKGTRAREGAQIGTQSAQKQTSEAGTCSELETGLCTAATQYHRNLIPPKLESSQIYQSSASLAGHPHASKGGLHPRVQLRACYVVSIVEQ